MVAQASVVIGMPHLDIHTLSEDWALSAAMEQCWVLMAESLGTKPSDWRDAWGERMYCAAMLVQTRFDLADVVREDDRVDMTTQILAIRKPHAWCQTRFSVGGKLKAEIWILTSFIRRSQKGSNKKFSKVTDIWQAADFNAATVEYLLDQHHRAKTEAVTALPAMAYEVNRIQDFNAADFMYFKNFVRIAKAAEWRENRGCPVRLTAERLGFHFGNVDDGEVIQALVGRDGDSTQTVLQDSQGRRLFLSHSVTPEIQGAPGSPDAP